MSKLVQESSKLIVSEQCRLGFGRTCKVHHNGNVRTAIRFTFHPLTFELAHPSTGTFAFTRVKIGIKYRKKLAFFVEHLVSIHFRMIYFNICVFHKTNAEQFGCQPENSFFYVFKLKIWFEHFVGQVEFFSFQFFGIIRPIPRLYFEVSAVFVGISLYFVVFFLSSRFVSYKQFIQQIVHIFLVFGHALHQSLIGITVFSE